MGNSFIPGLYLHIPFCRSKCGYCDFYSVTDLSGRDAFIGALRNEAALCAGLAPKGTVFDTVYLGGGTPSLMSPGRIAEMLDLVMQSFSIDPGAEITMEANPDTADIERLRGFRRAGVNRLSIGIQSFNDRRLRLLERIHTAAEAHEAVRASRQAGFDNISLDFIYGIPGQTRREWRQTLRTALAYQPEHISAYSLIIEPETPFYWKSRSGALRIPGDDRVAGFFADTAELLGAENYHHYEISNYARSDGLRSRHNSKYWDHTPYLGLGPSAHSFWQNRRWGNQRSLSAYIRNLGARRPATAFSEELTRAQLQAEYIMLALRTDRGIGLTEFNDRYGLDFLGHFNAAVSGMITGSYGRIAGDRFFLTEKGMLICDEITRRFTE